MSCPLKQLLQNAYKLISAALSRQIGKQEGALTNKSYDDALHIALATLNNVDVLVSWNFKHIVNLNQILFDNSISLQLEHRIMEIRSSPGDFKHT